MREEIDVAHTHTHGRYDIMVTNNISLPGKEDFIIERNDVSSGSHSVLLSSRIGLPQEQQAKKTQNYLPYRSAAIQRVNNSFQTASLFIKKQTSIRVPHPGRFYVQEKNSMNKQNNLQEYSLYRGANHQPANKVNPIN